MRWFPAALVLLGCGITTTWANESALDKKLASPVEVFWSDVPLRDSLSNLAQTQQVAILLDRRVDPGRRIHLKCNQEPLENVLWAIADQTGLGISRLGGVVYLGPIASSQRLRPAAAALEQSVRRLPPVARQKYLQTEAMSWSDLAEPRELLAALGRRGGVEIAGLDRMPHDLWSASALPPLSLVERLSLVAIQFDMTFRVAQGGAKLELIPLPDDLRPQPMNRPSATGRKKTTAAATDVQQVRIQRLTIRDEPLGAVIRQLADRLGLELRMDAEAIAAAGVSLDRRVSLTIENATVDDLFHQLLDPTGLYFDRRQRVLEIKIGLREGIMPANPAK